MMHRSLFPAERGPLINGQVVFPEEACTRRIQQGMGIMVPDESTLSSYLEQYLQARLKEIPAAMPGAANPGSGKSTGDGGGKIDTSQEASRKRLERYQYAIWRMKDRLSYGFFGSSSEKLADDFLSRFGIEVDKHSEEYYSILRRVLQTEMDCYSILMQQERESPEMILDYYRKMLTGRKKPSS